MKSSTSKMSWLRKSVMMSVVFTMGSIAAFAQTKTVSGTIVDDFGDPVLGANVVIVGTTTGVTTDIDGNFSLSGVPENAQLKVTFIGYASQIVSVAGQSKISVTIKEDVAQLEDVVVVGYGSMKKTDLTGSVSSLEGDKLTLKGTSGALEALQGSVPGANITQASGRVGGSFNIEIRGKSSINSSVTPLYVVDGIICDDIDFLNPQDIERIDILKDASSTAIYGSRATAGVVIVSTKSGASVSKKNTEKVSVSYDGYYGRSVVSRMPDFMTGEQFYNYRFMDFLASGQVVNGVPVVSQPVFTHLDNTYRQCVIYDPTETYSVLKDAISKGETYNWPELVTQDGNMQNHYLSVSGSSEKIKYHFGAGYNRNEGVYVNDLSSRFNLKGSVDADINKWFSAGLSTSFAYSSKDFASDQAIGVAYRLNPFCKPYAEDGSMNVKPGNFEALGSNSQYQFTDQVNPLGYLDEDQKHSNSYRMIGNLYVQYKPFKGFSVKSTFSPNFINYNVGNYTGSFGSRTPEASYESRTVLSWTWDNQIDYSLRINGHSINAMGLISSNKFTRTNTLTTATEPTEGTLWYNLYSGTVDPANTGTKYTENSMLSYALRLNYGYQDRYLVTATMRTDGSSRFSKDYRWGTFPSVALAWRLTEEEWMKEINWLSNLKLRVSYGVTGNNSGISDYNSLSASAPNYYAYGTTGATGYAPKGVVNSALEWEKSKEWNLGVDYGFLHNRINGSIEIYNKDSEHLLYARQLPLVAGGVKVTDNVGKVNNKGVEVSLNTVNFKNKNWEWTTNFTFAANRNEVKEIDGTSSMILGSDTGINGTLAVGQPVSNIYAYNLQGIVSDRNMKVPNNATAVEHGFKPGETVRECDYYHSVYGWSEGMPKIEDVNGDGIIDEDNDRKFLGSCSPAWTGNISSTLTYKDWDFSFSIYTKQNFKVYSEFMYENTNYHYRGYNNLNLDYYIPAGTLIGCDGVNADGTVINPVYQLETHYGDYPMPNASISEYGYGNLCYVNGKYNLTAIQKISYWKVKNISLGYNLPKKVLNQLHLTKLRVYCNVTNPFVFTNFKGFDPEWADASLKNDAPSTTTWQFGVNLKF